MRKRGTVNRDVIMNVASVMFRERGYDRTSLDDIAKALHITKPSLYYHFSSKEEILLACIETGYALFKQWLEERDRPQASGKERLAIFISSYVELLKDNVLSVLVSDERVMSDPSKELYRRYKRLLHQELVGRLEAGHKDGSLKANDTRHLAFLIFGMINWMVNWPPSEISRPTEEIAAHFLNLVFNGIAAD
ncbi:TetR/AcrR family transcriptional regulator [Sphingobium chlorophenolicum]|uniref:TetR/AcrR family transcriptional regulator n=1 Tax=Sphingobium chlorophenolicum TaxID=46429 RepID=UPI0002EA1C7F|nr:TetR/AcrR family transcriptional regulator [Sphingobium chlorophenolicum]